MNYGYFDDKNKEYVITNPELPTPWMNYLGNGGFGGLISATAGGLTFDGDPSNRRITRYKFNNMPVDRPGRYLYIRDEETGEYFSPMWQPVCKDMQAYECRHGLGYTKISGQYMDILSETTYFVPMEKSYEVWNTKLANKSSIKRKLKIFSYVEFGYPVATLDILCHWACMTLTQSFKNGRISVDSGQGNFLHNREMLSYIGTSLPVTSFDCNPIEFVGQYRSESNPIGVEKGKCCNSLSESDNCIGVLCSEVELNPDETIEFVHTLGAAESDELIDIQIAEAILNPQAELQKIKENWNNVRSALQVETPSAEMNQMLNIWHPYQAKTTFDWSRFISYYERGVDRGFGFRDSMQDVLGVMHNSAEACKERIKLLLSIQRKNGNAKSVYYPATNSAHGGDRSDDHLWSILSVCNYIKETGDFGFANEIVPFEDGGKGTVIEHLEAGISFTMNNLGRHGLPNFLLSDWDDSLCRINNDGKAESVFVFFQLAHATKELIELYKVLNLTENLAKMQKIYDCCKSKTDSIWDGEWFIRAFTSEGEKFCTSEDEFNKIHMIPQAWSVMSGLADSEKGNLALDNVMKYLYTDKGIISHLNASDRFDGVSKSYYHFTKGARENGGIFFHSNTWVIIALAMLGRADDAFKCYFATLPNRRNDIADLCLTEPYIYSQTMIAPPHSRQWQCVNSWLTGTASWMYYAATQYILGIRPEYNGLKIDPQVPNEWKGFKMVRYCRNVKCNIDVVNIKGQITVNGEKIEGNVIPWDYFDKNDLDIKMI